jgi:RIO kinase 1
MDANVRLQIGRAINHGYIDRCNGAVKEGKEAVVYHADSGNESGGFDVAIKVFKRIQDFKGRGDYVDGDPRYARENFRRISGREQLELWTEKEYRNLTRATRAGVPVPSPLFHKDNVLFMRFLGADGWPAPQLREIDIRRGSGKWDVLYCQVMDAVRKLYRCAGLVHADLSEWNVLVVPAFLSENVSPGVENVNEDLQAVLIDFGQAVDTRHPDAVILLQHDLDRIKSFFSKQGVKTMGSDEALAYVVEMDG